MSDKKQAISLAKLISNDLSKRLSIELKPKIDEISKLLKYSGVQTSVTNEHRTLNKQDRYRKKVLRLLEDIIKQLPPSHPLRKKLERYKRLQEADYGF